MFCIFREIIVMSSLFCGIDADLLAFGIIPTASSDMEPLLELLGELINRNGIFFMLLR